MVLLEALEESGVSSGGIIIPPAYRMKINQGRILEFGPDVDQKACSLKTGEIVIFPHHAEYRIPSPAEGKEFILVAVDQIIAGDNCTTPKETFEPDEQPLERRTPTGRRAPLGLQPIESCRICGEQIEKDSTIEGGYTHVNKSNHIALK